MKLCSKPVWPTWVLAAVAAIICNMQMIWIFVGAGLGGVTRHSFGNAVHSATGVQNFPLATILINVLGCLAIGFLATAFAGPWPVREEVKLGITVGVLGGFTTFSSFGRETIELFHAGRPSAAIAYVVMSNTLGITATWVGYLLAKRLPA